MKVLAAYFIYLRLSDIFYLYLIIENITRVLTASHQTLRLLAFNSINVNSTKK